MKRPLGVPEGGHELMADGRFLRVYYDDIHTNARFDGIRDDRSVMGSWLFLAIEAEKAWPSPAFPLPRAWVPAKDFDLFATRGIIVVEGDGRFSLQGLDHERRRRSEHGRLGADARWAAAGNAASNAPSIAESNAPGNAPASRENMPRAGARLGSADSLSTYSEGGPGGDHDRADIEAYLAVRFRLPTAGQRRLMDDYVRAFDLTGPTRAAELILAHPEDPIGALKDDLSAFRTSRAVAAIEEERAAAKRRADEKPSGMGGVNQEMARLMNPSLVLAAHNGGAHAGNPNPDCRYCREGAA